MTRCFSNRAAGWGAALAVFLLTSLLSPAQIESAVDPTIKMEIDYAQGLKAMGFPDFAKIVLGRIKDPAVGPMIKSMNIENLAMMGKFDEAKAIIAKEPSQSSQDVWAMKLALADGYYAWGRYGEAQSVYKGFFSAYPSGPPAGLKDFYIRSAYKYTQMLILMNKVKEAITGYGYVLKAIPREDTDKRHIRRQVLGESMDLLVKLAEESPADRASCLEKIDKILNEIMWVQDLWFGKGVVVMAHMKMMKGEIDDAMRLINKYEGQLRDIDNQLREQEAATGEPLTRLSPMAECRYLLGAILHDEAKKRFAANEPREKIVPLLAGKVISAESRQRSDGALQHFLKVFVEYPATQWAPDAGDRMNQVKEFLEKTYGANINIKVPPDQWEIVVQAQFQEARSLFNQQQFEKASEAYLKVLNLFPEREMSVRGLGELARCYIEMEEPLYSELVVRYISERFGSHPDLVVQAGDQVLRIARFYDERKLLDKRDATYDVFFKHFKRHGRMPIVLFEKGQDKYEAKDYAGAMHFFQDIRTNYVDSTIYHDALNKIAVCYSKLDDFTNEIATLEEYAGSLEKQDRPGHALINVKFRLAYSYQQMGEHNDLVKALTQYIALTKLLLDEKSRRLYESTPDEETANTTVLEGSLFYKGVCYAKIKQPEDQVVKYQQLAIQNFNQLVEKYPKSAFAPAALSQVGALYTILNNPGEAEKSLRRLQKEYPESPEAKNALFMLGKTLLELGMRTKAVSVFKEMFESEGGKYSTGQILTAGNELLKAKEYAIALQAFERVLKAEQRRAFREPAMLGQGKCLVELGRHKEGAEALDAMLEAFPGSGFTIEACQYQSRAYAKVASAEPNDDLRFDMFNNSVKALKTARKYAAKDAADAQKAGKRDEWASGVAKVTELDIEVSRMFEAKAAAEAQFGNKEKAEAYKNKAIASYQIMLMTLDASTEELKGHLQRAYLQCIPLLIETSRFKDAIADCDAYDKRFPGGKYRTDIARLRRQAQASKITGTDQSTEVDEDNLEKEIDFGKPEPPAAAPPGAPPAAAPPATTVKAQPETAKQPEAAKAE